MRRKREWVGERERIKAFLECKLLPFTVEKEMKGREGGDLLECDSGVAVSTKNLLLADKDIFQLNDHWYL